MKAQLEAIRSAALEAISGTQAGSELDAVRVQYLGKKGELTGVLKMMGKLSAEERPAMGQLANEVRAALEEAIENTARKLAEAALEQQLKDETVDVTIPGTEVKVGHKHPMYIALDEIKDIFVGMGFSRQFMLAAEAMASERVKSIRIDTHPDNKIMQRMVERFGYTYCGDVVIERRRLAYEKLLVD